MEHKKARNRLIYTLLIFILALVIANVFFTSVEKENIPSLKRSTGINEIDSVFNAVSNNFGFDDSQHRKYKLSRNQKPPLKIKHSITLPKDITTIEFIAELNKVINFKDVELKINEHEINGDTEIEVFAADTLKYWVLLKRDKNLERDKGAFVFLLHSLDKLNKEQFEHLFSSSFPFGLLIYPSTENKNLIEKFYNSRKEYSIILNDDIDEEIFKLEPDYGTSRLERSVINIVNNFGEAVNFYIDKNSEIYQSTSYNFVKDQFSRRGKKINLIHTLTKIESDSDEDLISLFDFYHQSIKKGERKLLLISAADYLRLHKSIGQIVKKGYKILLPSELK